MLVLLIFNFIGPVVSLYFTNEKIMKDLLGEPTNVEKKLSNKGKDVDLPDLLLKYDFWLMLLASFIIMGGTRTMQAELEAITLGDEDK